MKDSSSKPPVRPSGTVTVAVFVVGILLAAVTSGGLVLERLSSGSPAVALAVNGLVTVAAIVVLGFVERRQALSPSIFIAQGLGAVVGVVVVHVALRTGLILAPPWMSERPAQFVNDAVAAFSTLALVWASALGLDLPLLLAALLLVTIYRVTSTHWHVDASPHGFQVTVQDFVIAQFVAAAIALPVYRVITRRAD